jgi:hypothetical protein
MHQVDTAPTVAALLGANIPASAQGRARTEMLAMAAEGVDAVTAAETGQKQTLAQIYAAAVDRPIRAELASADEAVAAMVEVRAERLNAERLPRLIAGILALAALVFALVRARGRALLWGLTGVLVYLCLFNVRYTLFSHRTYSLTSVTGANELIVYVLINALLAFVIGWLVFVLGTRLFVRPPRDAARLTLGWALLAVAIVGLPALVSLVVNGPLIGWTLPEFWTFFLGFLAILQCLFIAVFGIIFAGIADLISKVRWPVVRAS